jgi:adenosylhomocysteine nucleosidase
MATINDEGNITTRFGRGGATHRTTRVARFAHSLASALILAAAPSTYGQAWPVADVVDHVKNGNAIVQYDRERHAARRYRTIGILGAFDGEVAHLIDEMDTWYREKIAQKDFHVGTLAGHRGVIVLSGVGLINAAHTTQILIDRFGADAIIFTGSAAPLVDGIGVLDSVVSTSTQQFTMDFRPLFPLGIVPFLKTSVFPSDPTLVQVATEAAATLPEGSTFVGKILSGDQLAPSPETEVVLDGAAVESEGAAVGQVCYFNKIPYVVIRTMSNTLADPGEFEKYQEQAALRSQMIALKMLQLLRRADYD